MLRINFLVSLLLLSSLSFGMKIQILHTNDLHSFLDHSGSDPDLGGYGAIKKIFTNYRKWGEQENIKTFIFDAGDFLEGNIFYKSENALNTFKAHAMLGYDAVTLGNHDYLMGLESLNNIIKQVQPEFAFLCGNIAIDGYFPEVKKSLLSHKLLQVEGYKISLLGVTTDSTLYTWRMPEAKVFPPIRWANEKADFIKQAYGSDMIISINHIGLDSDRLLGRVSKNIDLIIGGHSHDLLERPELIRNRDNYKVPIVQVGAHGKKIGRMIVELEKGKRPVILSYQTIDVDNTSDVNPEMQEFVDYATEKMEDYYGSDWMRNKFGESDYPLEHSLTEATPWSNFIADALKEATKSDVGIHTVGLAGHDQASGDVTMEKIMRSYPRFFELSKKMGWTVYTAKIRGYLLRLALEVLVKSGAPLNITGITFEVEHFLGVPFVKNVMIKGKKVRWMKQYQIALPEGIARGGPSVTFLYPYLFKKTKDSGISVWDAIVKKVKKEGHLSLTKSLMTGDRMFVPAFKPELLDEINFFKKKKLLD